MAASSINAFLVILDDPENGSGTKRRADPGIPNESILQDFRVLSKNTNGNQDIQGLLYVPEYPGSSPCTEETSQYIPQNVTRRNNLPTGENVIALAPWTSPECVLSLFEVVGNNVEAFIFYLPNVQEGIPPAVNDPVWGLGDGGSWKSSNKFPVYALPGPTGSSIMTQLGQYSGSNADAPNGSQLELEYTKGTLARMYAIVELSDPTSLPSLWAFLLIVLGIVLFLIGATSGFMHFFQRRRRNTLRRRIVDGEVDLERLGIKRLTVPQEAISMLPTFVYNPSEKELLDMPRDHITALSDLPVKQSDADTTPLPQVAASPAPIDAAAQHPPIPPTPRPTSSPTQPNQPPSYAQPTCPICLDDFIPHETTVRSLPCHHIYHPECIDPFLLQNSSLCPVCKSKVLPKGYCPETITNAMVRRERQQRRNRDRVRRVRGEEAAAQMPVASNAQPRPSRLMAVQGRMASFHRQFGRGSRLASTAGVTSQMPGNPAAVEMRSMNGEAVLSTSLLPSTTSTSPSPNPTVPPTTLSPPTTDTQQEQATPGPDATPTVTANHRSEQARRRASLFLREQQPAATAEEQEQERWAGLPKCEIYLSLPYPKRLRTLTNTFVGRKAFKSVFPGV
ncbi:MAG: hypothetical protein Q9224_003966 [Gallowayella concinna]